MPLLLRLESSSLESFGEKGIRPRPPCLGRVTAAENASNLRGVKQVLFLARAAALQGLADVQMYPPGKQVIIPSNADPKKKPVPMEVTIDEATAIALEAVRAEYQAKADSGEGDAPFFDFNHDDGAAAAWPKRIYWGGDDALLGGVRAECEPSSEGEEAVTGKIFRRFSPAFYQPKDGRITGAPVNMGGLVNRAAFTKIAPLFAKAEDETDPSLTDTPPATMTPEEIATLQKQVADLTAANTKLQTKCDEMAVAAKAAAETDAKNVVACAAKDGRIPPAPEIQGKWVAAIVADPSAKDLLLAMAPNPALLGTIVKAKASDPNATSDQETVQAKPGLEGLAEIIKAKRTATTA